MVQHETDGRTAGTSTGTAGTSTRTVRPEPTSRTAASIARIQHDLCEQNSHTSSRVRHQMLAGTAGSRIARPQTWQEQPGVA